MQQSDVAGDAEDVRSHLCRARTFTLTLRAAPVPSPRDVGRGLAGLAPTQGRLKRFQIVSQRLNILDGEIPDDAVHDRGLPQPALNRFHLHAKIEGVLARQTREH